MFKFVFYKLNTELISICVITNWGGNALYVLRTNVPNPFVNTNQPCTNNKTDICTCLVFC